MNVPLCFFVLNVPSSSLFVEDGGLVERARHGDNGAFRQLFERYGPLVYRVAYRMLGHPEDAADLTQDVFVRAYQRLSTLQHGQAFKAWITRLTVNLVHDHQRRPRLATAPLDPAETAEIGNTAERHLPAADPTLDEHLLSEELSQHLQSALLRLTPDHRAVIILHHLENLPLEEISTTLQLPIGTIKSRLARARTTLRQYLEPYLTD